MMNKVSEQDKGPCNVAVDRLRARLDELGQYLSLLRDRLEPVLRPDMPSPVAAEECPKNAEPCSALCKNLMHVEEGLNDLSSLVNNLRDRLDV